MMLQADKRQQFPDMLIEMFDTMSKETGRVCTTFERNVLGQDMIFT